MRSKSFRPAFDRLGSRIVLDGSVVYTGVPLASAVLASTGDCPMPGDGDSVVPPGGWNQGGSSQDSGNDPLDSSVPVLYVTQTSTVSN